MPIIYNENHCVSSIKGGSILKGSHFGIELHPFLCINCRQSESEKEIPFLMNGGACTAF